MTQVCKCVVSELSKWALRRIPQVERRHLFEHWGRGAMETLRRPFETCSTRPGTCCASASCLTRIRNVWDTSQHTTKSVAKKRSDKRLSMHKFISPMRRSFTILKLNCRASRDHPKECVKIQTSTKNTIRHARIEGE